MFFIFLYFDTDSSYTVKKNIVEGLCICLTSPPFQNIARRSSQSADSRDRLNIREMHRLVKMLQKRPLQYVLITGNLISIYNI